MDQREEAAPYPPPAGRPAPADYAFDPRRKSPALACFLSAMPGLGQVYVGYYPRGFLHAITVGSIIALLNSGLRMPLTPLLSMFLAFFWLYNIIDAGRRAALYNQALAGGSPLRLPDEAGMPGVGGSIVGGLILIGAGVLLLMHTRFGVSLAWVADWWPVAPIGFGLWLLYKGVRDRVTA